MDGKEIIIFRDADSLKPVEDTIKDAEKALNDPTRTIENSDISNVLNELTGAGIGAGLGGACSFAALYSLGTAGLSAAGITSGLAAAGSIIGGGMVSGIAVLAAPIVIGGVGAALAVSKYKKNKFIETKENLYIEALKKHQGLIKALKEESQASKERIEYLTSLNLLLQKAAEDLSKDLGRNLDKDMTSC